MSDPRPVFDAQWYGRKYGKLSAAEAWLHYREIGRLKGLRPNPLFDPNWYSETYRCCDREDALQHFVEDGAATGFWASPLFETDWYLRTNTDIAQAGVNPLAHFLEWGRLEGRLPASWCANVGDIGTSRDFALADDFVWEDLLGYFPRFSVAGMLPLDPDGAAFFRPEAGRWIFARLSDCKVPAPVVTNAIVIGGRREILVDGEIHYSPLEKAAGDTHRAFAVTYAVCPPIKKAVHLLGMDLARGGHGQDLKTALERIAHAFQSAACRPSILIDAATPAFRRDDLPLGAREGHPVHLVKQGVMLGVSEIHTI